MTLKEIQIEGFNKLKELNIEEPMLKSRLLLSYIIKRPKEYLITHLDEKLTNNEIEEFRNNIEKLKQRIPLSYVLHSKEFMKLNFYVDNNVLIPRADTEILVEEILKYKGRKKKILDLCTGSGAIGISLAKYMPDSEITGTDISEKAIKIAIENAKRNKVNVHFLKSNLYNNLPDGLWDVIISNPPYIKSDMIKKLQTEVRYEPTIALDGGKDGLDFYRKIIECAPKYLENYGMLALEIGFDQADEVINILQMHKCYKNIELKKDLSGNDRVILATNHKE